LTLDPDGPDGPSKVDEVNNPPPSLGPDKAKRGPSSQFEIDRILQSKKGRDTVKKMAATPEGRQHFGLDDIAVNVDQVPFEKQAEIQEKTDDHRHARHKEWAMFGFAVSLHVMLVCFLGFYCRHNSQISSNKNMSPEERKQAEANIEKAITGVAAYVFGTVGGYSFKTK